MTRCGFATNAKANGRTPIASGLLVISATAYFTSVVLIWSLAIHQSLKLNLFVNIIVMGTIKKMNKYKKDE